MIERGYPNCLGTFKGNPSFLALAKWIESHAKLFVEKIFVAGKQNIVYNKNATASIII